MNLHLTEIQVSNRYKTLMRSYKQVVDNNKKTGSAKKTHSYENELGKLLKDNPNIRLVHTLSSSALVEFSSEGKSSLSPSPSSSESSSRASSPVNPVSSRKKKPSFYIYLCGQHIKCFRRDPRLGPTSYKERYKAPSTIFRAIHLSERGICQAGEEVQRIPVEDGNNA